MRTEEVRLLYAIGGIALVVGILIHFFFYSMARQYRHALELRNENDRVRIIAQDEERRMIAADLHDDLGQRMAMTHMMLTRVNVNEELFQKILADAREQILVVFQRLKDTSLMLSPTTLMMEGPLYAFESFKNLFADSHPLKVTVHPIRCRKLTELQTDHVFHMLQEILQNAVKHSMATELIVSGEEDDQNTIIYAEDNGVGFVNSGKSRGAGLGNLQIRAEIIGAELVMETSPGNGTRYSIKIPLK